MEVNYRNCIRYKNFLDSDEQEYKDRLLTLNQIKELKAFKYKGYKDKIQKDRIRKNKIKGEVIKKADDAFIHNRQIVIERKQKQTDDIIKSLRYVPNNITVQKNVLVVGEDNINNDLILRKCLKSVDNSKINISSNSFLNNLKCSDQLTTEASLEPKLERQETTRTKVLDKKNKFNKFSLSKSYDQEFETASIREKEREKYYKLKVEREKLEEEFEILQKLNPDSEDYNKIKKLKLYDKKVLSLSNVNQLALKNSPSKIDEKKQPILPKISRNLGKLNGIFNSGSETSNKKINSHVSVINRTKNSDDLQSKIFISNEQNHTKEEMFITNCPSMSDLSKYFDDANEVLGEIDKVKKIRKNNSKNKESKLLNSIYRTSESREKKIKKIKRNYKDLPLEDYQVMLLKSISNQLEPDSITDLSQNFLKIRVMNQKVPLLEKMDYHHMVKKIKKDLSIFEEMKKIKKQKNENNKIPLRQFKINYKKNTNPGSGSIEKFLPKITNCKVKNR